MDHIIHIFACLRFDIMRICWNYWHLKFVSCWLYFVLIQSLAAVKRICPKKAFFIGMTHEFDHHKDNEMLEEWSKRCIQFFFFLLFAQPRFLNLVLAKIMFNFEVDFYCTENLVSAYLKCFIMQGRDPTAARLWWTENTCWLVNEVTDHRLYFLLKWCLFK